VKSGRARFHLHFLMRFMMGLRPDVSRIQPPFLREFMIGFGLDGGDNSKLRYLCYDM